MTHRYDFFLVVRTFKIFSLCNFQVCDTLLVIRVTALCVICPWLMYNYKFVPFNPLHPCWLPTQTLYLETTNLFSVFMFCSSWLLFDSTFKCGHTAFVFLGLISYSIMHSRFIHVITNSKISLWLVHNQHIKSICKTLMYKLGVPPHHTHPYSE